MTLDEELILAMHAALMAGHDPGFAGQWRTQQVWIGGDSYGPTVPPSSHRTTGMFRRQWPI